jgi:N,N'-diacetyllegionaminate synthase
VAVRIGNRLVERDGPPLVMAEIGVNHDGDVGLARQLVAAAAKAGADAVKFQLFDADMLLAREAGLVEYQKTAADSADDLLRPLQLSPTQLWPLVEYAKSLRLAAVVTPFSPGLVGACVRMGVDAVKLASPDLVNHPLVIAARATELPLILSTGAATMEEVFWTKDWLGDAYARTVFLHCVSSYPTPADRATLGAIEALRDEFASMMVGYSDHTRETATGGLAVIAGACLLEKHLTLDRKRPGPDHAASLEPGQLAEYVTIARQAFVMRGPLEKKPSDIEMEVRHQTRQSVVARHDLPAGSVLTAVDLTVKRPGTGIPAAEFYDIIGRRLVRAVEGNSVMKWADLEGGEPRWQ